MKWLWRHRRMCWQWKTPEFEVRELLPACCTHPTDWQQTDNMRNNSTLNKNMGGLEVAIGLCCTVPACMWEDVKMRRAACPKLIKLSSALELHWFAFGRGLAVRFCLVFDCKMFGIHFRKSGGTKNIQIGWCLLAFRVNTYIRHKPGPLNEFYGLGQGHILFGWIDIESDWCPFASIVCYMKRGGRDRIFFFFRRKLLCM